jgi:hypothetical protein
MAGKISKWIFPEKQDVVKESATIVMTALLKHVEVKKTSQCEIKPGDVIWANRIVHGKPYNHCGIYEGDGQVIHFAAPQGSEISQENAVVHRVTLENFANNCPVKIVDFPEEECFCVEETINRAQQRIGERGYNFATNNCDHFATWCKTGQQKSLQFDEAKKVIRAIALNASEETGLLIADTVCALHDILEQRDAK